MLSECPARIRLPPIAWDRMNDAAGWFVIIRLAPRGLGQLRGAFCFLPPAPAILGIACSLVRHELAGRNAGAFAVGVSQTGNEHGFSPDALAALSQTELDRRLNEVASRLYDAGAELVIRSVAELPDLFDG
jgi:hypothetical protein